MKKKRTSLTRDRRLVLSLLVLVLLIAACDGQSEPQRPVGEWSLTCEGGVATLSGNGQVRTCTVGKIEEEIEAVRLLHGGLREISVSVACNGFPEGMVSRIVEYCLRRGTVRLKIVSVKRMEASRRIPDFPIREGFRARIRKSREGVALTIDDRVFLVDPSVFDDSKIPIEAHLSERILHFSGLVDGPELHIVVDQPSIATCSEFVELAIGLGVKVLDVVVD